MNNKFLVFTIILIQLVLYISICAQDKQNIVAQIGKDKITVNELKMRLELSPYLSRDKGLQKDSVKYDFLYSLIAEKLWAKEAERLGFANSIEFKFFIQPLEDLFVRDALYKKEIEGKINITKEDINDGVVKSQSTIKAQFISSTDSNKIFSFYNSIGTNNFDSLLSFNKELSDTIVDIKFGQLDDKAIEDSVYRIEPGKFSAPIFIGAGFIIIKILDRIFTPIDIANKQTLDDIQTTIRNRKIEKRYFEYRDELLSGTYIKIQPEALSTTHRIIWNTLNQKAPAVDGDKNSYEISEADFKKIIKETNSKKLNSVLFKVKDKDVSVFDFLSKLGFNGFNIDKLDSIAVFGKLNQYAKYFVEEQVFTYEAIKQNMHLTPAVRNDLITWKQNYLAKMYLVSIHDGIKVSDNDLYDFYKDELLTSPINKQVNLLIITQNNLEEMESVLEKLKQGIEFDVIAKGYGKTDSLVNDNGSTGLTPIYMLDDIGSIAENMNVNEVFGPVKRNNVYSIIKMIDKQNGKDSLGLSFDSVKSSLRTSLRYKLVTDKLNEKTSALAEANNVKIYSSEVDKVKSPEIQMFVHRFMGFGGRIAAIPVTTPFSSWIESVSKKKLFP